MKKMMFPKGQVGLGLNAEQKVIALTIFGNARGMIEDNRECWVCCAVERVSEPSCAASDYFDQTESTAIVGRMIRDEIELRLDYETFITGWVRKAYSGDPFIDGRFTPTEYRLAWIDSMIQELQ